jgi:arabinose-5-phosphate isomerase
LTDAMLACQGRVIVTGMGKSGHIGAKIAATFQSTGQRACFLDPAAAAHGDMGMIDDLDMILMLSNSGETEEMMAVSVFAEAEMLPVAIITSRPDAVLARRAQIVLAYPRMREGCPIDKAPMASACAQLAIGDAIAARLMIERGFTAEDFTRFHHGGYLGRSNVVPIGATG